MGLPPDLQGASWDLHLAYEPTSIETLFRDERDPEPRSRRVFGFHRPETLAAWHREADTHAAVTAAYRLIKHAGVRCILFLVDRRSLGRQALAVFQSYVTPDDGRKSTEIYNGQHMTTNMVDPPSRVCIATIQRLFPMLRGDAEFAPENEGRSQFETALAEATPHEVAYNSQVPPGFFGLFHGDLSPIHCDLPIGANVDGDQLLTPDPRERLGFPPVARGHRLLCRLARIAAQQHNPQPDEPHNLDEPKGDGRIPQSGHKG